MDSWGCERSVKEVDGEFESYVRTAAPALLRLAVLLTGSFRDGEELVQDALARVYLNWSRVSQAQYQDAYARRIMVNTHRRQFRRRRVQEILVRNPHDRPEPVDPALGSVEDRAGLLAALRALPVRQRAVVVLRCCEDLSEREVATLLGTQPGTVKSQLSKGLARLRANPTLGSAFIPTPGDTRG